MLEAIYHTRVIEDEENNIGRLTYVIDETELEDGFTFKIIAYSKTGGYVLTLWALGDEEETMNGETLWRGETPILSGGGELTLYRANTPDSKRLSSFIPENIWDEYAQSEVQISDAMGIQLRENLIYL